MKWGLAITNPAKRTLRRLSSDERRQINNAFSQMAHDPFVGDVRFLRGANGPMRRRVGDWRIFYDLNHENKVIVVMAIKRRSSNTY